jgi:Ca-activated chloride channel family protein
MRAAARWETIERALNNIAESMTDADRVTLIGFSEHSRVLAQDMTPHELQTFLGSGKLLPPSGSANFAAGVDAAARAARAPSSGRKSRIVFLTASQKNLEQMAPDVAKRTLTDSIGWQMVCLAEDDHLGGSDSRGSAWAESAGGRFTLADSSATIQRVLVEALTGRSGAVAKDVSVKVSFNPRVVTGYRLLGHEAVTLTGGRIDPITIELAADQSVTGLYEVWIKPKGDDIAATAELTWKDPDSGQPRRVVRPLRRAQLAGSFSQAPPWLQQGIVAAKAAEAFRGSYYAKAANPLAGLLELTDQVDPQVKQRPEFQDLLRLLQQADKGR